LRKWGKNKSGSQKYRCVVCEHNSTRKRVDLEVLHHQKIYEDWLTSKQTLTECAVTHGVTRQTLNNWFLPFREVEIVPTPVMVREAVLILDGYYVERFATVLIAQTTKQIVTWLFTQSETSATWGTLLLHMPFVPFAVVCDGQKGILRSLKTYWPSVIIQRCQFHVIHYCLLKLTKHPETQAGRDFRLLVIQVSHIKTKEHLSSWLLTYRAWYQTYKPFLKEKTYQEEHTFTGRQKWHYTHGRLHSAHSHLKNALPNLFKYLLYPQIPNTSNHIEGGTNAHLQEYIHLHRGLTIYQRRQLIALLLKKKQ
jgi:hypothetical protein